MAILHQESIIIELLRNNLQEDKPNNSSNTYVAFNSLKSLSKNQNSLSFLLSLNKQIPVSEEKFNTIFILNINQQKFRSSLLENIMIAIHNFVSFLNVMNGLWNKYWGGRSKKSKPSSCLLAFSTFIRIFWKIQMFIFRLKSKYKIF